MASGHVAHRMLLAAPSTQGRLRRWLFALAVDPHACKHGSLWKLADNVVEPASSTSSTRKSIDVVAPVTIWLHWWCNKWWAYNTQHRRHLQRPHVCALQKWGFQDLLDSRRCAMASEHQVPVESPWLVSKFRKVCQNAHTCKEDAATTIWRVPRRLGLSSQVCTRGPWPLLWWYGPPHVIGVAQTCEVVQSNRRSHSKTQWQKVQLPQSSVRDMIRLQVVIQDSQALIDQTLFLLNSPMNLQSGSMAPCWYWETHLRPPVATPTWGPVHVTSCCCSCSEGVFPRSFW